MGMTHAEPKQSAQTTKHVSDMCQTDVIQMFQNDTVNLRVPAAMYGYSEQPYLH